MLGDLLQASKLPVVLKLASLSSFSEWGKRRRSIHLNKSGSWGIAFQINNLLFLLKRQPDVVVSCMMSKGQLQHTHDMMRLPIKKRRDIPNGGGWYRTAQNLRQSICECLAQPL